MAKATKAMKRKIKKKIWFKIIAPALFNNQVMGETLAAEPDTLIGKTLPINLMNLTRDMRQQNIEVLFKVNKVAGEKASTELIGYRMSPSSIKRIVRRNKIKIDQSLIAETADNIKLKLKLIMLTVNSTNKSVATALRKAAEERVARAVKKLKYDDLVQEIVKHKMQNGLRKQLSKVYPLRICEIRYMGIEKAKQHIEEEAPKEEKKPKKKKEVGEKPVKTSEKKEE